VVLLTSGTALGTDIIAQLTNCAVIKVHVSKGTVTKYNSQQTAQADIKGHTHQSNYTKEQFSGTHSKQMAHTVNK
jgi:hypothetical protein